MADKTKRSIGRNRFGMTAGQSFHALFLGLALSSCGSPPPPAVTPEVGYVTLRSADVPIATELTGRTVATTASNVRPQVDGIVQARLFAEGSLVRAGQPLYRIDARLYRASRDQAAANLESARASYLAAQAQADRYRTLSDMDAVSRQQVDDTTAAARQALATMRRDQAILDAANINLGHTVVRAPISGRIGRSAVTPGALVTASQATALATIQQFDPIYVDITQSGDALTALRRSLAAGTVREASGAVHLRLQDGFEYPRSGTLEFAEAIVNQDSGTVTLRARFPNPQGYLLPGMFVRVTVPQGIVPGAVLVPQQGVTRDARGNGSALVVGADDKVVQRTVTIRQAVGANWLITAGLNPGDRLIVEGTLNARPGSTVKPVAVSLDEAG